MTAATQEAPEVTEQEQQTDPPWVCHKRCEGCTFTICGLPRPHVTGRLPRGPRQECVVCNETDMLLSHRRTCKGTP